MEITLPVAERVLEVVNPGLSKGMGTSTMLGHMCIEAAVAYALGLPHTDRPTCVSTEVRYFAIGLNDLQWQSNEWRADGLRRLAVAQLGSNQLPDNVFSQGVFIKAVNTLIPYVLRKECLPSCRNDLKVLIIQAIERMEKVTEFKEAARVVMEMEDAPWSTRGHRAFKFVAQLAETAWQNKTGGLTVSSAYKYSGIIDYDLLRLMAKVGVDTLIELKSPGAAYLYLCDDPEVPQNCSRRCCNHRGYYGVRFGQPNTLRCPQCGSRDTEALPFEPALMGDWAGRVRE